MARRKCIKTRKEGSDSVELKKKRRGGKIKP